jgi:hypothetical protein
VPRLDSDTSLPYQLAVLAADLRAAADGPALDAAAADVAATARILNP